MKYELYPIIEESFLSHINPSVIKFKDKDQQFELKYTSKNFIKVDKLLDKKYKITIEEIV
ncbi:MAG: hypothetical protein M0R17_03055 [Candidatus Omnitrophica bacterium]|jgi:hypothetical protein|nr:hypothetical protein [Candidatus Omnitrophota bacterium]